MPRRYLELIRCSGYVRKKDRAPNMEDLATDSCGGTTLTALGTFVQWTSKGLFIELSSIPRIAMDEPTYRDATPSHSGWSAHQVASVGSRVCALAGWGTSAQRVTDHSTYT